MEDLFLDSFADCQRRFQATLPRLRACRPGARLMEFPLAAAPDLAIMAIAAEPSATPDRSVIFTVGQHDIEGYVGSAMLELFVQEFVPRLNAKHTGLLLVHPVNPWGMKHRRRTNAFNVDLNRNFVPDPASLSPCANPDYTRVEACLMPRGRLRSAVCARLRFGLGLACGLARLGPARLRRAVLLGQYCSPRGLHYGGNQVQEETRIMMRLFHQQGERYDQVLHLDMHTGYGPPDQMTIIHSALEPASSDALARRLGYPRVARADPAEFYSILGDMIDYQVQTFQERFPAKRLYAASFEFGTVGEATGALLYSLRTMILESQMHWYGAPDGLRRRIEQDFEALFFPRSSAWQDKAVADARQAFQGILQAEGYLTP
ncbi:MAG: M14 family metallopeptidase [Chloroflexota bacterium]